MTDKSDECQSKGANGFWRAFVELSLHHHDGTKFLMKKNFNFHSAKYLISEKLCKTHVLWTSK